jgi:hypothetical protein
MMGAQQQETNQEQEPGAHPLVGETPEGEGPLASPLVGGGAGKVPCCAQCCSWCVQWVATAHAEVNAGVEGSQEVRPY